jgi:hypothetical protein
MSRSRVCLSVMSAILSLVLLVVCESATAPRSGIIEVDNLTHLPLYVVAVELQRSQSISWAAHFQVEADDPKIIAPGASRLLAGSDIYGGYRRGQGLYLGLYEVKDGEAFILSSLQLSPEELEQRHFRVDLR